MNQDLIPLRAAADMLGISPERVRQLVVDGRLPGLRFGNSWAVPRSEVLARRNRGVWGGRPLGPLEAWRQLLAAQVNLEEPGRYGSRSRIERCQVSAADLDYLLHSHPVMEGGVPAAIDYGALLFDADSRDIYLSESLRQQIDSEMAIVMDPLGPVRLHIVNDDAWALLSNAQAALRQGRSCIAPKSAVALDLVESPEARIREAAEKLMQRGNRG